MSWSPADSLLFQLEDTATNLNYLLTYEGNGTVTGYQFQLSPEVDSPFFITSSVTGVNVKASSLSGLFNPDFIKYWTEDGPVSVSDWPDLSAGKELIEFKASSMSQIEYKLTVTVTVTTTNSMGISSSTQYSNTWSIVVLHSYSGGRDKLLEYMSCQL